jgi:hypothetical protein
MPIHFRDLDVVPELSESCSALIVPCNMCPAVTVAVREEKPFLKLCGNFLKSAPFALYLNALQARLKAKGINSEVFDSYIPHQWFMCMWTAARRKKLQNRARLYDAVIVLGCASATETVREAVASTDCKIIEGMEVSGIMNAQLRLRMPCNIVFEKCKIVPV